MPSRIRNHPMPLSWRWLRPIPERRPAASYDDGASSSIAARDRHPLENQGRGAASGDGNSTQARAAMRRNLFAILDSIIHGTFSPSGRVVTEADAPEEPSEPGPAAEAVPEVPVQDPTAGEPDGEPEGEPEGGPAPEIPPPEFWSTNPLRCEGCLCLPQPFYEAGLEPWHERNPQEPPVCTAQQWAWSRLTLLLT